MKKLILFAAILFAGVSVAKAQDNPTTTAVTEKEQSTLTVRLKPYQTIAVTGNAEIVFDSMDDYSAAEVNENTTSNVQVNVSSAGGFTVKVYAEDLKLKDSDNTIDATNINVLATAIGKSVKNDIAKDIKLNNDATPLIQSEIGKIENNYTVAFKAINGEVFRAAFDGNGSNTEEQVYTTTVYYEIAAK